MIDLFRKQSRIVLDTIRVFLRHCTLASHLFHFVVHQLYSYCIHAFKLWHLEISLLFLIIIVVFLRRMFFL
jgi:hypothetical protein